MWDFDGDEVAFFILSAIAALILAVRYFRAVLMVSPMVLPLGIGALLWTIPFPCLIAILFVLCNWSDPQTVRGHVDYITLFMAGGALWLFGSISILPLMGVSLRNDAIERKNPAALAVGCGMMLNGTLCYAGSNIGSGPTIWTTILPAAIASLITLALWLIIELFTRVSEMITIERHLPSGLIMGAFLVLAGAFFGWGMSGDWENWTNTMSDFVRRGWPVLPLAVTVIILLRIGKPRCNPAPTR